MNQTRYSARPAASFLAVAAASVLLAADAAALDCDLSGYQPKEGLSVRAEPGYLEMTWAGAQGRELRLRLGLKEGQPIVREMAYREPGGGWRAVAENLRPEFHVTTGKRRISRQQLNPLRDLGIEPGHELIDKEKWNVFWDAPLVVPGLAGVNPDLPRRPEEIQRAAADYRITGCAVRTRGARLEATFDGVSLGVFSGKLRYTVYRGTNLVRQEVIAKTEEPSVAYKYRAGLAGFRITPDTRVVWRDTSRAWQRYEFGGAPNQDPVALRARNRLALVELAAGTLAVFPPPHKFFFAREIELNLGYVWYRKDGEESFSVGVRQADREEMFRPYGFSDELWNKRVRQARHFALGNFALYNAPPGTWQRMAVYFYLSPEGARATQQAVLKFTHGDRYKPLDGYKVLVNHFHTHFAEQLADAGGLDFRPPWIAAFRALGINIAVMSDFHGDGHPNDPGPLRFAEQHTYFEACRRHSDRDFLIVPGEEPNAYFGGHYNMVFPRPVYWTKVRGEGQEFVESHPKYGRVYHAGSAADVLELLRREDGVVWQAHPRTKGSTGYPDAIRDTPQFRSGRFLGGAFQSLPADLSQDRLCEARCLVLLDDMNNWGLRKYLIADGDTYTKYPEDEIYPHLAVNYVRLHRTPGFDEGWAPVVEALREGEFFVTTGEVLIPRFAVETGEAGARVAAEVAWTFPLEFVEAVWGDGRATDRTIVSATDLPPFGRRRFTIPFDAQQAKWVRFAAWDSAGNGAFTQPVHLRGAGEARE